MAGRRRHSRKKETAASEPGGAANPDPITGEPGAHPLGTGLGSATGAATGVGIGAALGGPAGAAVGGVFGAALGAAAGHAAGEAALPTDPAAEEAWNEPAELGGGARRRARLVETDSRTALRRNERRRGEGPRRRSRT